jgi:regulatory protein
MKNLDINIGNTDKNLNKGLLENNDRIKIKDNIIFNQVEKCYEVYLNESFVVSISEEDYIQCNIYEKDSLPVVEILELIKNFHIRKAKSKAIKYLAFKARTEGEVRQLLLKEEVDEEIIILVLAYLAKVGYLNDMDYARKFILDRMNLNPKSKRFIALELKNKGITTEVIEMAFDETAFNETAIIQELLEKKFGKYDMNDMKIQKKIYSFLEYRGFTWRVGDEY